MRASAIATVFCTGHCDGHVIERDGTGSENYEWTGDRNCDRELGH